METRSWGLQLQEFIFEKLGLCRRCISIAVLGTIISWGMYILVLFVFAQPILLGLVLIAAIGFTILLLAHLAAYFFRVYIPLKLALRNSEVINASLSISALDPEHVSGTYTQENIGLSFDSRIQDKQTSLVIRDLAGNNLILAQEKNGNIEQSILEGRLTISTPKFDIPENISQSEMESVVEKLLSEVSVKGEEDCFRELLERPEYGLLPVLSKALGISGLYGNRFPAIAALHLLALGAHRFQQARQREDGSEPPTNGGPPDVVYRIIHPFQEARLSNRFGYFLDGDIVPCDPLSKEIHMFRPGYEETWTTGCSTTGCKKSKCKCSDDMPNRDESCFGMCGDGCCCWCWICGDCCFHEGCAIHDLACRGCSRSLGLNATACSICYTPPAGIGFTCRL